MAEETPRGNKKAAGAMARRLPAEQAENDDARRRFVALSLGDVVPGVTRSAYRRRSPAGALLLSEWERVVGPRLAQQTSPHRLSRGVLTIACGGPVAMELQHVSASLIDRINTHAGEALVSQLRFVQAPVAGPSDVATPAARRRVAPAPLDDLPEGPLNDALARLLAAIRSE